MLLGGVCSQWGLLPGWCMLWGGVYAPRGFCLGGGVSGLLLVYDPLGEGVICSRHLLLVSQHGLRQTMDRQAGVKT